MIAAGVLILCIAIACAVMSLIEPVKGLIAAATEFLKDEWPSMPDTLPVCPDDLSELDD